MLNCLYKRGGTQLMYNNYVLTHVQVWCRLTERWSSCKRSWRRAKRSRATACRADSRLSRSWRTNTWRRRRRGEYASACSKTSRRLTALDLSRTLKLVFSQFSADCKERSTHWRAWGHSHLVQGFVPILNFLHCFRSIPIPRHMQQIWFDFPSCCCWELVLQSSV